MSRWKRKGAKQAAEERPMSGLYEELKGFAAPMECTLGTCGGIVQVDSEQLRLLTEACFGSPLVSESEDSHTVQLTLEEAFYLAHEFRCLDFYHSREGRVRMTFEEVWSFMLKCRQNFTKFYKAYSHLRTKGWVVRPGPQYGADFMAYKHHPSLVHSDYAVLVMFDDGQTRMTSWTDVESMTRLCGSVAKTLMLVYVQTDENSFDTPCCLERLSVETVEVKRWLPEKNRED